MEQQGTIKSVGETQQKTDNFKFKEVVIVTEDKYPQTIIFQFSNKNIDALNGIEEGQKATIHFNLRGREYNGRVFNSLDAWKVTDVQGSKKVADSIKQNIIETLQEDELPF